MAVVGKAVVGLDVVGVPHALDIVTPNPFSQTSISVPPSFSKEESNPPAHKLFLTESPESQLLSLSLSQFAHCVVLLSLYGSCVTKFPCR